MARPLFAVIKAFRVNLCYYGYRFCPESSARFRLPAGRRDKQWLSQRDQAQQNLSDLWKKARHVYQMTIEASKVSQFLIEPQLAMMKQGDSPENKAQLEIERQQIPGRLRAARQSIGQERDTTQRYSKRFPRRSRSDSTSHSGASEGEDQDPPRHSFRIDKLASQVRCSYRNARHGRRSR